MPEPADTPPDPTRLVRPMVRQLHAYTPGEQPKVPGLVKLNTNENPYPPSPHVLEAVRAATDERLRLYPSSPAEGLRQRLAKLHGCDLENLIVGNGSDELLALAVRGFVEPSVQPTSGGRGSTLRRATVQYFTPSYSLYPVLADIHGAVRSEAPLSPDFSIPAVADLRRGGLWDFEAALTLVTTPNAPSGRAYSTADLEALCREMSGVVLLDEAYVDFAGENALSLALRYPHVLVARTFSKAYSLCFQRVGYLVGHPVLISALHKIRDSYNVNGLGQIAAEATLEDLPYYRGRFRQIIETRHQLAESLQGLGFGVLPSQTNFLLVRPPCPPSAESWLARLREENILVRWFNAPAIRDFLRISIGTEEQANALAQAAARILGRSVELHQDGREP